jgi:hypothetical protein
MHTLAQLHRGAGSLACGLSGWPYNPQLRRMPHS